MTNLDFEPNSLLRIKIFPHEKAYPPHYQDSNRHSVELEAKQGQCELFAAEQDHTKIHDLAKSLGSFQRLRLNAKDKRLPFWIRCGRGLVVKRAGKVPSYAYDGEFYVHKTAPNKGRSELEIVNIIGLEPYLRGVVPSEVFVDWPLATLRSQAVAARTYAIFHLANAARILKNPYYDFDDTIRYQAYTGLNEHHPRTDDAVMSTRGEILVYKNNVIQAYYHADSGGHTESPENVWRTEAPFVESRSERSFKNINYTTWRTDTTLGAMATALQRAKRLPADVSVVNLYVPAKGMTRAKRVQRVEFALSNGTRLNLPWYTFKDITGLSLPSQQFAIKVNSQASLAPSQYPVTFFGRGLGHGVGMSQIGAAYLGKLSGWDYQKILRFYYKGVRLCSIGAIDLTNAEANSTLPCYNVADGTAAQHPLFRAFDPNI